VISPSRNCKTTNRSGVGESSAAKADQGLVWILAVSRVHRAVDRVDHAANAHERERHHDSGDGWNNRRRTIGDLLLCDE
jgi:hypothetical protein